MNTSQPNRGATTAYARGRPAYRLEPVGDGLRVEFVPPGPLDAVYAAVARVEIDAALDVIYDRIDDLMRARAFESIDELLSTADLEQLDPTTATGLLAATLPVANQLHARRDLGERVRRWLVGRVPATDIEALLAGLL